MAKKYRIPDGPAFDEVLALLMKCTRQLRAMMPPGADLSRLDRMDAEQAALLRLTQSEPTASASRGKESSGHAGVQDRL
jgi:hypothetical protein